jgi:hypothetical protein
MTSVNSIFEAHIRDYGWKTPSDIQIYIEPGSGKAGAIDLTYNTECVYVSAHTDLKKGGPTVVEIPRNVLGGVNDRWQHWRIDLGNAGPDIGKGGKYFLLPPGYEGEIPGGYFINNVNLFGGYCHISLRYDSSGVEHDLEYSGASYGF